MADTIETISQINTKLVKETRKLNPYYVNLNNQRGYRIHPIDSVEGRPCAYILGGGPRLLGRRALFGFMWPETGANDTASRQFVDVYAAIHYAIGVHYAVAATDEMIEGAAQHVGMNVEVIQ